MKKEAFNQALSQKKVFGNHIRRQQKGDSQSWREGITPLLRIEKKKKVDMSVAH